MWSVASILCGLLRLWTLYSCAGYKSWFSSWGDTKIVRFSHVSTEYDSFRRGSKPVKQSNADASFHYHIRRQWHSKIQWNTHTQTHKCQPFFPLNRPLHEGSRSKNSLVSTCFPLATAAPLDWLGELGAVAIIALRSSLGWKKVWKYGFWAIEGGKQSR